MASKPTCRKCGVVCEWGDVDGQWRLFNNGEPHRCFPKVETVQPDARIVAMRAPTVQERYDEPLERTDTELLARQVARLATAVEGLAEEQRLLRVWLSTAGSAHPTGSPGRT